MASILGMLTAESFSSQRYKAVRREVFRLNPGGAAPLTGVLSMLKEEKCNDPEFKWFEKRPVEQRSLTVASGLGGGGAGPFSNAGATAALADNSNMAVATEYNVTVADDAEFRIGHVVKIEPISINSVATAVLRALVTGVDRDNNRLKFRPLEAYTAVGNAADEVGLEVLVIGSAHAEGAVGSNLGRYREPVEPYNYCQIFRTPWRLSGTTIKTAIRYDEEGPYKERAAEAAYDNSVEMEKAFIFGVRSQRTDTTLNETIRTTGGILWYLQQWELGTVYENSTTAITLDTNDQKRIIENSGGSLSMKTYSGYLERVFRWAGNKANEKLCLCGSGALAVLNEMYEGKTCLNANLPMTDTWGMNVVAHTTPFGTVYYKTHPLFSQNAVLRNCMLILDTGWLKYRYVDGRDVKMLTERQPNNADYREDEWLGECGLEVKFPEAHMFIKNITSWTP